MATIKGKNVITLTAAAKQRLQDILDEANNTVRVSIIGGGCSGFNYAFAMKENDIEGDIIVDDLVVIDPMSMMYLDGASLDYKEGLGGAMFEFNNPMAKSTCGCGSSFSV